ncbi:H-NS histone family protein [Burkholderia ubonensis]|uniref:H-NS histone family protein n=1 Tax=Burkholderia ubonensis TaxID=101571 RepID=UPI0009B34733|nr:H-NS histone family protein [Burkholderia ubonensis]
MRRYANLLSQYDELQRELDRARKQEVELVVDRVLAVLAESGIAQEDLMRYFATAKSKRSNTAPKPKYWNPKTGETWSGRGRAPRWLEGQDRTRFLLPDPDEIASGEQATSSADRDRSA